MHVFNITVYVIIIIMIIIMLLLILIIINNNASELSCYTTACEPQTARNSE